MVRRLCCFCDAKLPANSKFYYLRPFGGINGGIYMENQYICEGCWKEIEVKMADYDS